MGSNNQKWSNNVVELFLRHVGSGRVAFVDLTTDADLGTDADFSTAVDLSTDVDLSRDGHDGSTSFGAPLVTYEDLADRCGRVAAGLAARGLVPGDRVAILANNSVDYGAVYLGTAQGGMVTVPLNAKLAPEALQWITADAGVALVIADDANAHLAPTGVSQVVIGSAEWAQLLDTEPAGVSPVRPEDIAVQMYTSGSTGRPKGVLLSHGGQRFSIEQYTSGVMPMDPDERLMVAAPMWHKNAQMQLKMAMSLGGTVILMPGFDPETYLRAAAEHGATSLSGVPTMFWMMLARPDLFDELDLSSVQRVGIGSAPMTEAFFSQIKERFADAVVTNGYGTTEVVAVFGGHPDGLPRPTITVGYPLPTVETRLVDPETGGDAVSGEDGRSTGELWVRSAGVMQGYHGLPEVTASRLTDGWYHTGDVVERDADGWHWFVGRVDDMFVCGGENIYPGEVEALLERHPDVLQAAVVPVEDRTKGALPVAFVVREQGATTLAVAAVKQWALDHGPAYQHPRDVWFVDELPLAGTNKVDKAALATEAATRFTPRS